MEGERAQGKRNSISKAKRDIKVFVTGFGPFEERCPNNPSGVIVSTLPASFQLHPSSSPSAVDQRQIILIRPQHPIKVSYQTVISEIPTLLTNFQDEIDIVLHVGMASGRKFYELERRAHREGYDLHPDVDGCIPHCDSLRSSIWRGLPAELVPSFDTLQLLQRWRDAVPPELKAKLRPSDDAGSYLCEFIYFTSLAWFQRLGKEKGSAAEKGTAERVRRAGATRAGAAGAGGSTVSGAAATTRISATATATPATIHRPVMFLHVPGHLQTEELIEEGRQVVMAMIRALVECCGTRD